MQKLKPALVLLILIAGKLSAQTHKYDSWEENFTVSGLLGAVQYDDLKFSPPDADTGETEKVDVSLLPQLGGAWTTLPRGERFQYGLECSFLLGFRFDKINYLTAGGGGLYVSLSTSMWTFDLAGGAYAGLFLDKGRKVRIYAGSGPLMLYAHYRTETDDGTTTDDDSESVFGLGWYARTGFEFRVHEKGMLGLGARANWAHVDFSEIGGTSEIDGIALFASYTAGF
ncbi:hypothetical protein EGM51_00765 [Verrucomicrobia bacterium S94]|nr:hypothetical protein EGM51_00765 [Verrucomicrobia bacterium S94]